MLNSIFKIQLIFSVNGSTVFRKTKVYFPFFKNNCLMTFLYSGFYTVIKKNFKNYLAGDTIVFNFTIKATHMLMK